MCDQDSTCLRRRRDTEHCPSNERYNGKPVGAFPPTLASLVGKVPSAAPAKLVDLQTLQEHRPPAASGAALKRGLSISRQTFSKSKSMRLAALSNTYQQNLSPTLGALAGTDWSIIDCLEELGDLGLCSSVRL